jgi:rod shape-determining protein MreC
MESVFGRYRNLIVLVGVLFIQILGLAVQVKRTTDSEPTRLIRVWAVGAVTPLEKALYWVQTSTGSLWHNYFYLRGVRAENRELKQEIQQMRLEQARLSQDADQARRLQALLAFKEQFISQTMAAQVIGGTGSEVSRSVYIDKGEHDGVRPDMAVITKDGIVGKVLRVYRSSSLVLLIDDQTSGVGAILDKSRLQGILRGTSSGEVVLEKVMSDETVPVGEQVLTSGGDGIFPKGLPVGRVTRVSPGNDLFLNIRVRPSADLSRLEEVLVVTKIDERQAEPEKIGPVRAVDILAERLPTVPPKPENNVVDATGKTSGAAMGGVGNHAAGTGSAPGAANGLGTGASASNKLSVVPHSSSSRAGAAISRSSSGGPASSTSPNGAAAGNPPPAAATNGASSGSKKIVTPALSPGGSANQAPATVGAPKKAVPAADSPASAVKPPPSAEGNPQ